MKQFRLRSLNLVQAALNDVAAGKLTANQAYQRLVIDLLHDRDRRVYYFIKRHNETTTTRIAKRFRLTLAEVRRVLVHLIAVGLIDEPGGKGHTRPYTYRVKGGGDGH